MSHNPSTSESAETVVSSQSFKDPEADITFRSSDNVKFHIHSRYLTNTTHGFAPEGITPAPDEVIPLTENASTLELLFQFVYPQKQPDLDTIKFANLAVLTEAVEKYEVFPAMQVCKIHMRKALPKHAVEVLNYAVRHDYPDIADEAAPHVSLEDMSALASRVDAPVLQAWIQYHLELTSPVRSALKNFPGDHLIALRLPNWANHLNHHYTRDESLCENWGTRGKTILASLSKTIGGADLESLIQSTIAEDANDPPCCRKAITEWRSKVLTCLQSTKKFSQFLYVDEPGDLAPSFDLIRGASVQRRKRAVKSAIALTVEWAKWLVKELAGVGIVMAFAWGSWKGVKYLYRCTPGGASQRTAPSFFRAWYNAGPQVFQRIWI